VKTLTATEYMMQLLDPGIPPEQPLSPDEAWVSWPFFLTLLEQFCAGRGDWQIEYNTPQDYSCAIFAHEPVSEYQLPLFPDFCEFYASRFISVTGDCQKELYNGDFRS
jgi:hypothetical protein